MDPARIIQVDGFAFRDMNGNGLLDLWEDWRQPPEVRAQALAETLDVEGALSLLFHGGASDADQLSTNTEDFTLLDRGSRAGISRLETTVESIAADVAWINRVQARCEAAPRGIPYLNSTDPYQVFELPHYNGLICAMDRDLWRQAGMWTARAYRASGVRLLLGPQVNVCTEPRSARFSGTGCEDPALVRDLAAAFAGGMQSTWADDEATMDLGWGTDSVAVMLKHYAGEGAPEGGRDDHDDMGKWHVFSGGNFRAHLIPYLDGGLALDSATGEMASVMPSYAIPYDPNDPDALGPHVGCAFSKPLLSILRNSGWDGLIVSDWMVLEEIPHGVRDLTVPERMRLLLDAGCDQHGGTFQPDVARQAFDLMAAEVGEKGALARIRDSARRLFLLMIHVGLFEQPYSEREQAKAVLESPEARAFGLRAGERSVVMLKNHDGTISRAGLSGKVYVPLRVRDGRAELSVGVGDLGLDLVTDGLGEPTGPIGEDGAPTYQESDIFRLSAMDLMDVSHALVGVDGPRDAFQGVEGGVSFQRLIRGQETGTEPATYRPVSLTYRPYLADGPEVRARSLNPADEFGTIENRSYRGQSTHATNEADLDLVLSTRRALPVSARLVCVIRTDRPMVFSELEPACDAIVVGFTDFQGRFPERALARVASGKVEPTGLLPCQMPRDMATVEANLEDVSRDLDPYVDADGNAYDFCFGLDWSGRIDDDRVRTYDVAPLTGPMAMPD